MTHANIPNKTNPPYAFSLIRPIRRVFEIVWRVTLFALTNVYIGKALSRVPAGAVVIFPIRTTTLCCGLSGIVGKRRSKKAAEPVNLAALEEMIQAVLAGNSNSSVAVAVSLGEKYLGGPIVLSDLLSQVRALKNDNHFTEVFTGEAIQTALAGMAGRSAELLSAEEAFLAQHMGRIDAGQLKRMDRHLEMLRDIIWCLSREIAVSVNNVRELLGEAQGKAQAAAIGLFRQINAVLSSIDRLEVRGRDSAGISLIAVLDGDTYDRFTGKLTDAGLTDVFSKRSARPILINQGISIRETIESAGSRSVAISITYKTAAEIGSLGDNVRFLRDAILCDPILQLLAVFPHRHLTVSAHTRWASVGAISEANCHPVDSTTNGNKPGAAIIHACLNGDIDNHLDLKQTLEIEGCSIHPDVTTDTKIIPLQINKYLCAGVGVEEAFRLAVNDFTGSHAICMHTDLAPGKLFLAQRGSGQAIFVGLADGYYMPVSEVYGFVEETDRFLKLNGESVIDGCQGQIMILDQDSSGDLSGIRTMRYDGTLIELSEADVRRTDLTSRDIDRQHYPHYFLKEISESPDSVEKTIQGRWAEKPDDAGRFTVNLDEQTVPESIRRHIETGTIHRIIFIGQGTAGVAAQVCADILAHYLDAPDMIVCAHKSSELSGFKLHGNRTTDGMADTLVVAISQSGTTTDTNRAVDMVRARGARTLAIVNRRDSDITFKVDGVFYTSSGRDIEMSVASTKAFYSQIVAGALLGLQLAVARGKCNKAFVDREIRELISLPGHMRAVLAMKDRIQASARRLAAKRTYWATVGSGPNKSSADEIRIKLSELCYKTISSDFVEDKKHIDLSSEPLIIVCAAGTRGTVIGDIIKDTAIFKAHKAAPIVIADTGEERFAPYAEDVFHVPTISEHLSPVLNTLAGHIWGYYAALAINEASRFLYEFREKLRLKVDACAEQGMDVYETVLDASFREIIAEFYKEFSRRRRCGDIPSVMGLEASAGLTLLLKYLSGRLPVADFELDFGRPGTAMNILEQMFMCLGEAINGLARPVDAIKHQAKTVTVGTSRIRETVEGILFEALGSHNLTPANLNNTNILVLKNLQPIISGIDGTVLYRINGLNLLGELTEETTIHVKTKTGLLKTIPSRVEVTPQLTGTKRIIVRQGNVYIGKGRKDGRSIILVPLISTAPSTYNIIEHLLLLNISFRTDVPLSVRIKALGGKYEHIVNIVQENSFSWKDEYLEWIQIDELFGRSAEKISERICRIAEKHCVKKKDKPEGQSLKMTTTG